jgi:hypothetical protein
MGKSGFTKKNLFEKLYLKVSDKKQYKKYKYQVLEEQWKATVDSYLTKHKDSFKSLDELKSIPVINVAHSGNAGDIIYSLPTLKKINQLTGRKFNYYLRLNQPHGIGEQYDHPLGLVMLNEKMANMLKPLLEAQPYIEVCTTYEGQLLDIDLDNFRKIGLLLDRGDISRWCSYITGITPDLYQPWLEVEPDERYSSSIVVARSERYRNPNLDFSFLANYEQVFFVGIKSEYEDIKKHVPNIEWVEVDNFLQLAMVIKGSKAFVGNQSFPFSIAEGLKVPRILEMCVFTPNVIPQGVNGYDIYFQNHFESLVDSLKHA